MTIHERRNLIDPVRECVLELEALGRFTIRAVVEMVQERYPERVASFTERLVYQGLSDLVRRVLKTPAPRQEGQRPLFLPTDIAGLKLPMAISIMTDKEDGGVPVWIAIYDATFAELELNIMMLELSIARDQKSLEELTAYRDRLAPIMADGRRDEPIGPVLKQMQEQEEAVAA